MIVAPIAASPDAGYGGFFYRKIHLNTLICHYLQKGGDGMVGFEEMRDELLERIEDLLKRKQYTALRDLLADL